MTADVDGDWRGWVTIRDRDYMAVIDAELRCREIAGKEVLLSEDNPRADEHRAQTWEIIDRSGQLLDCPVCGRLMWTRPGEEGPRVFRPE